MPVVLWGVRITKVLEGHKRERVKDDEARELLKAALRNDRASALLRETEIAEIVEVMEYFEFTRGETSRSVRFRWPILGSSV